MRDGFICQESGLCPHPIKHVRSASQTEEDSYVTFCSIHPANNRAGRGWIWPHGWATFRLLELRDEGPDAASSRTGHGRNAADQRHDYQPGVPPTVSWNRRFMRSPSSILCPSVAKYHDCLVAGWLCLLPCWHSGRDDGLQCSALNNVLAG